VSIFILYHHIVPELTVWIVLEHGAPHHKARAIDNLVNGLTQYASHEQSLKAVVKALKEGGTEVLDRVVAKLCEPPKGYAPYFF